MRKPVLLLLPGLLCDEANWAAQCTALAELADCRVPVYRTLDSIEAMAAHVLAVAPTERFALAGHSMGGRVALEVVRCQRRLNIEPGRVAKRDLAQCIQKT